MQLDDERYALVLGMDPTQALKPTLILYDADIPKQEALIVDLGQEPKLAIARAATAGGSGVPQPAAQPQLPHRAQPQARLSPL
ncbi:hypothetical protein [Ectopseudomonas oleovorans]|uniref:hypothetical protein n=1 Tax=Ectopseudomonas oleovorans TaxID=301 RepID=UPI0021AD6C1A|nr:hypothetical protein [Pseudomonas oleovorans]